MGQIKITQVHGVDPIEYKESIMSDVRAEFRSFAQQFQPIIPPEYLTRQEVAEILKVSLVTLSDWNKKKILNPYRLGNLIRYKRSEIEQALICINAKKV
jgi:excisionase family DNA binding protein